MSDQSHIAHLAALTESTGGGWSTPAWWRGYIPPEDVNTPPASLNDLTEEREDAMAALSSLDSARDYIAGLDLAWPHDVDAQHAIRRMRLAIQNRQGFLKRWEAEERERQRRAGDHHYHKIVVASYRLIHVPEGPDNDAEYEARFTDLVEAFEAFDDYQRSVGKEPFAPY